MAERRRSHRTSSFSLLQPLTERKSREKCRYLRAKKGQNISAFVATASSNRNTGVKNNLEDKFTQNSCKIWPRGWKLAPLSFARRRRRKKPSVWTGKEEEGSTPELEKQQQQQRFSSSSSRWKWCCLLPNQTVPSRPTVASCVLGRKEGRGYLLRCVIMGRRKKEGERGRRKR